MSKGKEFVLILRTADAQGRSYGGFQWLDAGKVEASDWNPHPGINCGEGLHGLLWGEGDGSLLNWAPGARWYVVRVEAEDVVPSSGGGKVRFRAGEVVHLGDQRSATQYVQGHGGEGKAIVGLEATAGFKGQATAGRYGQATAGDEGQATAGDEGQATAGRYGQATAGRYGQATAGVNGMIRINWWDGTRERCVVGYIGEVGLEPEVRYRLRGDHWFESVPDEEDER